jgi:flagellar protein FlbD
VRAPAVKPPDRLKACRSRSITRDVIRLHRLGHRDEVFHLNPDLILTIESTPDTVVTLTTHSKVLVAERPEEVVALVRDWRAGILEQAFPRIRRRSDVPLALVSQAGADQRLPEPPAQGGGS